MSKCPRRLWFNYPSTRTRHISSSICNGNKGILEDQDAEEPDDYVVSLITQINRRDEAIGPFIAPTKRNYVFGGICTVRQLVLFQVNHIFHH
ncbi:hypothetical protein LXL04_021363 [Taraxacum kok-saghyz]